MAKNSIKSNDNFFLCVFICIYVASIMSNLVCFNCIESVILYYIHLEKDKFTLECTAYGMRFTFSPRQTIISVDMISLGINNNMTSAMTEANDTHAWANIDFEACNTTMEMTSQHIIRNAIVEIVGAEPNSSVTRSVIGVVARYSVSCQYDRSQNVSQNNGLNTTGVEATVTVTQQVTSLADFNLTVDTHQDATLTVRLVTPTFDVGEPMYLAVTNHHPDGLKILVDTCFASASPDPSERDLDYIFLHNGCPYDDTFENITSPDDQHQFGFKIDAFVLIKRQSQVKKIQIPI